MKKRVLNDFAVTYQQNHFPPLSKIWQLFNQLDPDVTALKVIYASSNGHPLKIHFLLRVFLAFLGCDQKRLLLAS